MVFTSDGVVAGVVIRSVERYDLVKIKPTQSEAEQWFCLWLRRLRSVENSESQAEAEEQTNDNVRLWALQLVGSSASASDSDNLVYTGS